jgi:hypothetical protein
MNRSITYTVSRQFITAMLVFVLPLNNLVAQNKPTSTVTQTPAPVGAVTIAPIPAAYPAGTQENYVRTCEALGAYQDPSTFSTQAYTEIKQSTDYYDGLGRPIQTVVKQITPGSSPTDMVMPAVYDDFGREQYKYMGYASTTADGNFKPNPFNDQSTFSQTQYPGEQVFYSETDYEPSPLNRPIVKSAQGNSWAVGSGKSVQTQYLYSTTGDNVRIWTIGFDPVYTNNVPLSTTFYSQS